MALEDLDGNWLIRQIDARIAKLFPLLSAQHSPTFKSQIASTYTSGNVKTKGAGQSDGTIGKVVLMPTALARPQANADALEQRTGSDSIVNGLLNSVPDYTNSYFYIPSEYPQTTTTTNVGSANQVRFFRFNLTAPMIVKHILFETPTGSTGVNFSVSIYDSTGTIQLITTGAMTENILQNRDVPDTSLCTSPYICAYSADNTGVTFRACQMDTNAIALLNSFAPQIGTAATVASSGACPASLGVLTGASINFPLVVLQG